MKRRITFWLLVCLFVCGVVLRILHFPFRASAVMRVIPADAVFMSRHVAPGARVLTVLEDGLVDPVLRLAGFAGDHPGRELAQDAGTRWLARRLGQRYLATAHVERFGGRPVPALIASAWVGGIFTHLANLGFLDDVFPDFRMLQVDKNTRIWRGHFADLPPGYEHVSFGIYEGVAFGVATDDPVGAAHLYRVMRRQMRSSAPDFLEAYSDLIEADVPDRLLIRTPFVGAVLVGVVLEEPGVLELRSVTPLSGLAGGALPSAVADIVPFAGATALLLGTTASRGMGLLERLPLDPAVGVLAELLFTHASVRRADAGVVAWLADWDSGGRIMRLRVPSVAIALENVSGASAIDVLSPVLQRFNSRYNTTWRAVPHGQRGVLALLPPQASWYGRLPPGERAGFAVWNGYAILHSSADALDAQLGASSLIPGVDLLRLPGGVGWYAKMDMPAAGDVLRMGLASYVLWLAIEGRDRDQQREAYLRQVAEAMKEYAVLEATLREDTRAKLDVAEIKLQLADGEL